MAAAPITTATLTGKAHHDVEEAIRKLVAAANAQATGLSTLVDHLHGQPTPLTLAQIQAGLSVTGTHPLNVIQLLGAGGGIVRTGPHTSRLTAPATTPGQLFYETDRQQFYVATGTVWLWAAGFTHYVAASGLPADLGPNDAGFPAWGIDTGLLYVFSGNLFHIRAGIILDVFANRQATPFSNGYDTGVIFVATDRGGQAWRVDYGVTDWLLIKGWGAAMQGTITGPDQKPSLGANDAGFRFYSTDFRREYTWSGAAWADSPGQDLRSIVAMFTTDPGAGWYPMDGASHTISTSTGGTSTDTPPDFVSINAFMRSASSFGGTGTFGTTGSDYHYGDVRPFRRG